MQRVSTAEFLLLLLQSRGYTVWGKPTPLVTSRRRTMRCSITGFHVILSVQWAAGSGSFVLFISYLPPDGVALTTAARGCVFTRSSIILLVISLGICQPFTSSKTGSLSLSLSLSHSHTCTRHSPHHSLVAYHLRGHMTHAHKTHN